ncbi:hypothetical protein J6590_082723 [Homalodisca vitripennis]|nr:hypothetical protein J6590_082723 [Homalodisca vitripennis]
MEKTSSAWLRSSTRLTPPTSSRSITDNYGEDVIDVAQIINKTNSTNEFTV